LPIGQGRPPARLLIPALGLDAPVLPMGWHVVEDANGIRSEWDVVDAAAGHHIDSVFPGEAGNVVLSGHNNIGGAVFRSVCVIGEPGVDFGLGDEMIVQDEAGRNFVYRVEGWQRFAEEGASIAQRQANARYLAPTERAQLTLITCWPPTSNTHRVVVTGLLTEKR
jgi:sortase A